VLVAPRNLLIPIIAACFVLAGCNQKTPPQTTAPQSPKREAAETPKPLPLAAPPATPLATADQHHTTLTLPTSFGRHTGDLNEMAKRRTIRALVVLNPVGFFYLSGRPQGIQYEALQEFEKFVNRKLKTGRLPLKIVFLPMRPDQLEAALTEGIGDIIAHGVAITADREQRVAFSVPIQRDVSEVIVTGASLTASTFDGLVGTPIYVNPLTVYYDNLTKLNDSRRNSGKPPLDIRLADKNLFDDDLIEMVNADLIPATVTNQKRADLWAQVLPNLRSRPDLAIAHEGETAWVMRRNTPQLKRLVDEFLRDRAAGTAFGNMLLRRYLQDTKWVKNSLSSEGLHKFVEYSEFFRKYGAKYNFDYLMIAAQGYQESLLDQSKRSPAGAVGVMQVMPKLAAAPPINIPNVNDADGNIHAGTKMLHHIANTYFTDPAIDPLNKALFAFAAYNAGPTRVARLRKKAQRDGLDPNIWFGNVELEVAKDVGQETVIYVGNIYKYYVAYKLAAQQKGRASRLD
jgi:membrane-bound lytic murein transglycosylase MltF